MTQKFKKSIEEAYKISMNVPWTQKNPPEILVKLIETKKIKPYKVLDVGCGEGFYSIYLAKQGFEVIGIDLSKNAINLARENAKKENLNIRFLNMSLFNINKLEGKFDFILEWAVLHHINPKERVKYIKEVSKKLKKRGKYLSVCFNDKSPLFTKPGKKVRIVPESSKALQGTKVYMSSLSEMENLFRPYFKILISKIIQPNTLNYLFMEKNEQD